MIEYEARQIIDAIAANTTNRELHQTKIENWMEQLLPLNAEDAARAAAIGSRDWQYFPSWATFWEAYRYQQKRRLADTAEDEEGRCQTCGGDKMVVVEGPSDGYGEQMAPCPDCNPGANTDFIRGHNGSKFRGMRPDQVRERLAELRNEP